MTSPVRPGAESDDGCSLQQHLNLGPKRVDQIPEIHQIIKQHRIMQNPQKPRNSKPSNTSLQGSISDKLCNYSTSWKSPRKKHQLVGKEAEGRPAVTVAATTNTTTVLLLVVLLLLLLLMLLPCYCRYCYCLLLFLLLMLPPS